MSDFEEFAFFWGTIFLSNRGSLSPTTRLEWLTQREGWQARVHEAVRSMPPGEDFLILWDRPLGRHLWHNVAERLALLSPNPKSMRREISKAGAEPSEMYKLWPNARAGRVVIPMHQKGPFWWAARTGLLGGGTVVYRRWLLRRCVIAFIASEIRNSFAIVCQKPGQP